MLKLNTTSCIKAPLTQSTAKYILRKAQEKGKRLNEEVAYCEQCKSFHITKIRSLGK